MNSATDLDGIHIVPDVTAACDSVQITSMGDTRFWETDWIDQIAYFQLCFKNVYRRASHCGKA